MVSEDTRTKACTEYEYDRSVMVSSIVTEVTVFRPIHGQALARNIIPIPNSTIKHVSVSLICTAKPGLD